MATANVSREALTEFKSKLGDFRTSVETTVAHTRSHAEEVVKSVRDALKKQRNLVIQCEKKVEGLRADVERLQTQIIANNNKLDRLAGSIAETKSKISELESRLSRLREQLRQLSSQSPSDDENGGVDNSAQIGAVQQQIQECEKQLHEASQQLSSMLQQQSSLKAQNAQLKSAKAQKEAELAEAKNELNNARNKLERMKSAAEAVEIKVSDLMTAVQRFNQTVITTSGASKSGLEKCILAIDEYMATNLSHGSISGAQFEHHTVSPESSCSPQSSIVSETLERTLFELSVLRDDLCLGEGDPAYPQLGGIYGKMQTREGYERHHIPSNAVQNDNMRNLPAILISSADHALTDSYRWKQQHRYESFLPDVERSESYRNEIASEIAEGNYITVVRNEIYNIIDTCGHRYDGAISQYLDALEDYLRNNKIPEAVFSN